MWVVAVVLLVLALSVVVYASANIRSGIFIKARCVAADGKGVLLTFDDGPDPEVTPRVLDVLDRHGAKAIFFVIGSKAETYPDLLREIRRRGHVIGNHTYSHSPYANFLGGRHLRDEIARCDRAVYEATGEHTVLFRPPLGISTHYMGGVLTKMGMEAVGWSVRSFDTRSEPREVVLRRVVRRLHPGAIVLLHDRMARADWLADRILSEAEANPAIGITPGGADGRSEAVPYVGGKGYFC